jgi:hypothetical protein
VMTDDIVTRLRNVTYGVESVVYHAIMDSIDEIERLQNESDLWRNTCIKLIGMILPYSLLMRDDERKELAIILKEAVDG